MLDPQRSWDLWRRRNEKPEEPTPPRSFVALDFVVPAVMAFLGAAVLIVAYNVEGVGPIRQAVLYAILAVGAVVSTSATILGLALIGRFLDVDYGPVTSVVVKALGLVLFVDSLWLLGWRYGYPLLSWVAAVPLAALLVIWLFRQRGKDAVVTIVGLFVIRLVLLLALIVTALVVSSLVR